MVYSKPIAAQPRAFGRAAGLSPRGRLARLRVMVWLAGVLGFVGLLLGARYLPHPDAWRAAAIVWFLVAGALNTYFALKRG